MRQLFIFCTFLIFINNARADTCTLYYQDYSKVDWIRWTFSSPDIKTTDEFLKLEQNLELLKEKGYTPEAKSFLMYNDLMSFLSMEDEENGHAIRIKSDSEIILYKRVKFDGFEKHRIFNYTFESINDLPNCGGIEQRISKDKSKRDYYIQAYENFFSGSIGKMLIHLEAIAKTKKKQSFSLPSALRNYEDLLNRTKEHLSSLDEPAEGLKKIHEVRTFLLTGPLGKYSRSQTSIIDALRGQGANCVGNSALLAAMFIDLDIEPPEEYSFGIELFSDHVQINLVKDDHSFNWNLFENAVDGEFDTPIFKLRSYLRDALITTRVQLFSEESDNYPVTLISRNDYLFFPEGSFDSGNIGIDGVGLSGSETEYKQEELDNRIDIFGYTVEGASLATYSTGPIPESVNLGNLINKGVSSTDKDMLDFFESAGLTANRSDSSSNYRGGSASNLTLDSINSETMYDDEAVRIYTESSRRRRYTDEAVEKFGYQHIKKYFPSNHPIHGWAGRSAVNPLHIGSVNVAYNRIEFRKGLGVSYKVSKNDFESVISLPYMDRYHYFFNTLIGDVQSFTNFRAPELIHFLKQNPTLSSSREAIDEIYNFQTRYLSQCGSNFFIRYSSNDTTCEDFFNHNIANFSDNLEKLFLTVDEYLRVKLYDMHGLVHELAQLEKSDFTGTGIINRIEVLGSFLRYKQFFIKLYRQEKIYLPSLALKFLLRNPDVFYTTELTEEEKGKNLSMLNSSNENIQSIEFFDHENSFLDLPPVNLPKVNGLSPCFIDGRPTSSGLCSISTQEQAAPTKKILDRKVMKLDPKVLPLLLHKAVFQLNPVDTLFLSLSWTSANSNYMNLNELNLRQTITLQQRLSEKIKEQLLNVYVKFSAQEIDAQNQLCNQKELLNDYRNCMYELSYKKFSNIQNNLPAWTMEESYLAPIYNGFMNSLSASKWNFLSEAYDIDLDFRNLESPLYFQTGDILAHMSDEAADMYGYLSEGIENASARYLGSTVKFFNEESDFRGSTTIDGYEHFSELAVISTSFLYKNSIFVKTYFTPLNGHKINKKGMNTPETIIPYRMDLIQLKEDHEKRADLSPNTYKVINELL